MDLALTLVGAAVFSALAWAVRGHFVSPSVPTGMKLISLVSCVGMIAFVRELWWGAQPIWAQSAGLAAQIGSAALFAWAVNASRRQRLTLAFDIDRPVFVLKVGPYRFVRHPFYTSYILFWIGCALAAFSLACAAMLLALVGLYTLAALAEEKKFRSSELGAEYARYAQYAGLFWPKVQLS